MAITRLVRRVPDAMARVEMVPYWDPDEQTEAGLAARDAEFHYAPMSKAKHLYILHDTKRQAQRLGLSMVWPIDDKPWWELPHLAFLQARRRGVGPAFYFEVMAARWERGENICEAPVIRDVANRTGLDARELLDAPYSAEIRAEGVDCLVAAYQDDIFGVPYFRIGRHRFWGLDRVDGFIEALEPSVDTPTAVTPESVRADLETDTDTDTAGGCG
jgi:2-hydroxychromene-2-carboxylate isomerase